MAKFIQAESRQLFLTTPLGEDVLLLTAFSGREELSRLFSYRLELLSEDDSIAARDIVGKPVTWSVRHIHSEPRHFHGFVNRFVAGGHQIRGLRTYRAEVVPWLWFLTRTTDCRIFQNKTAPDILKQVFADLGFTTYQFSLSGSFRTREYCVQFGETAFNFVSRLMEQEGIFYFFRHEAGKHTLVLANAKGSYEACPEGRVAYSPGSLSPNHISSWEHQYEYRSGRWTSTDYNFETPSTNLLSNTDTLLDLPDIGKYELFDYPGGFGLTAEGRAITKIRMEEEEAPFDVVSGSSRCCTFTPGGRFTLEGHDCDAENRDYVITSIQHSATETSYQQVGDASSYFNTFTCIPDTVAFRPARLTPIPVARGPQTAVVVGPRGEEIYTDKYGRVKVQFFWDRAGKKDENSSCWIRVAENWAGKNWGIIFNPRIGQEVVVDFLDGDPDRPLITGRVYNAEQSPPYALPANQTQSAIKTRSSKGGGAENFNELRFEDKKGSEDIYFHAEKDFHRVVENDDDLKVGRDQTIEVKHNRTETVLQGHEKITISKGNRNVLVESGDDCHQVDRGNRAVTIGMGNDSLTIKMGNQTTKLNLGKSETEAMQSIELKVGQSSIKVDQTGVTIKGMVVKVEGQVQTEVKGLVTQISGSAMLIAKGGVIMIG